MNNEINYNIPSLSLADFLSGDPSRKGKFVRALGKAYEDVGFVAITNHGFSEDLQNEIYEQVKAFFDLDDSLKVSYKKPELNGQRGYTSFGTEHAKDSGYADLKEFWQFGQCVQDDAHLKGEYPKNVSVSELPQFNPIGMKVYKKLENIGNSILEAIAIYLELPEDYFNDKVRNGNSILRAIHYPPITEEPKDAVRSAAHEDINLITLLMGASTEGLEILSKEDKWIPVTALPNSLVVNVGDMLQRLTNNKMVSTTHRVVNPPREKWHTSRYSIPFFLHPLANMDLSCLENCTSDDNPKAYSEITAGEYLDERLVEIGLKTV